MTQENFSFPFFWRQFSSTRKAFFTAFSFFFCFFLCSFFFLHQWFFSSPKRQTQIKNLFFVFFSFDCWYLEPAQWVSLCAQQKRCKKWPKKNFHFHFFASIFIYMISILYCSLIRLNGHNNERSLHSATIWHSKSKNG